MMSLPMRRTSGPKSQRRKPAFRMQVEDLEGRALLTATVPVNFGATVTSPPVVMNNKLFFVANNSTYGTQVWASNGTTAGTIRLTSANTAHGGIHPTGLTVVGNTLYFGAGVTGKGTQLWKSNGT